MTTLSISLYHSDNALVINLAPLQLQAYLAPTNYQSLSLRVKLLVGLGCVLSIITGVAMSAIGGEKQGPNLEITGKAFILGPIILSTLACVAALRRRRHTQIR